MIVSGIRYVAGRNDYSDRDGTKYGVAIHNTSNTASAAAEATYATRRTDGTSSHFYVDGREVIQSLDTKYRAGHAGSYEGNEHAVSVEITGTNDKSRAWWIANVAWDQLGRVLAAVCRAYDIEPRRASVAEMQRNPKVRAFYSHDDMRRAWGGTTHTDPGPNFPWDHLFAAVKTHLSGTPEEDDMPLSSDDLAAIRTQVGKGMYDALYVAATGKDYNGLTYSGAGSVGSSIKANLRTLTVAPILAALAERDDVDEQAIIAGVLAGLPAEKIAAAIPAELARDVANELAARLAG